MKWIISIITLFIISNSISSPVVVDLIKPQTNVTWNANEIPLGYTNIYRDLFHLIYSYIDVKSTKIDRSSYLCKVCKDLAYMVRSYASSDSTYKAVKPYAIKLCEKIVTSYGKRGDLLCPNIIEAYGPHYWFVVTFGGLKPERICSQFKLCPEISVKLLNRLEYFAPSVLKGSNQNRTVPKKRGEGRIKILMMSDAHISWAYSAGSPTECGLYGCCYKGISGMGSAGEWGDYRCDVPMKTVRFISDYIKRMNPKPDFVVYGGDTPAHHIWKQSWDLQKSRDRDFYDYLATTFKNWTIYPVLGNHDSFPNSAYNPLAKEYWLFNKNLSDWWKSLFPVKKDQERTINHAGYYSVLIKQGLRLLAINTNFWLFTNPYHVLNNQNPVYRDQLIFISDTLSNARANGEKVIIAGHFPALDIGAASPDYPELYTDIVGHFSDVIALQLFGHTHHNQFAVVLDLKTQKPIGVQFLTGSLGTFTNVNPSFAIYYLDNSTFQLVDHESYYFDIEQANAGRPEVKRQLLAKHDYKMADLSVESFYNLINRFDGDRNMLMKFVGVFYSQAPESRSCSAGCQKGFICSLYGVTSAQHEACRKEH